MTESAGPELRIRSAAAQSRIVSVAGPRLDLRKSVRPFKGIFCDDISEFESDHLSQPVQPYPPRKIRRTSGLLIRVGASPSIARRPLSRI
jgi:hypothetical protein